MAPELPLPDLQSVLSKIKNSESLVVSIITHQFPARDLYKLCPPDVSEEASLYKTPSSVLIPLEVYFAILCGYLGSFSHYIVKGALAYFKHLQYLSDEYEWSRVLEYHCTYFDRQVAEMRSDPLRYHTAVWLTPDYQLMGQLDPIQTITVMLRATYDPFADGGIKYYCYAKHTIFRSLSWLHLPHPFNVPFEWKILDVDCLRGGTSSGTELPMSEVFRHHLLSPQILDGDCLHGGTINNGTELPIGEVIRFLIHEPGGKYPFLTLISFEDFYSSRDMWYVRKREKACARNREEMNRQAEAEVQRKAERNASYRGLLPRALGIFRLNRNPLSSAKSTAESSHSECDSMDKKSKTVSCA